MSRGRYLRFWRASQLACYMRPEPTRRKKPPSLICRLHEWKQGRSAGGLTAQDMTICQGKQAGVED